MEKTELSSKQEKQEFYNSLPFESSVSINIAVVGKTGTGKSSFINAFLNLTSNDSNAAKVRAGVESVKIKEECAKYAHKIKYSDPEIEIKFFDTMGFNDTQNLKRSDIEAFLKEAREKFSIIEFDAIIFITADRLSAEELEIAKYYEEKNVIIFFVYNKMDEFLEKKIRELTGIYSKKKSFNEQYSKNKENLMECVEREIGTISKLIDSHSVFKSFFDEIEKFASDILNSNSYKTKIIRSSIYFITAGSNEEFLDECYSKDGNRLKNEIEKSLMSSRLNISSIDLLDPFSERIIRQKKKYLHSHLFKNGETVLKMFANSAVNNIPFLDSILSLIPIAKNISESELKRNLKMELMHKFGISTLRDKFLKNQLKIGVEKYRTIGLIFKKIDNDEVINVIDFIEKSLENKSLIDITTEFSKDFFVNIKDKFRAHITGIGAALDNFCRLAIDDIFKLFVSSAKVLAPISILFQFLKNSLEKILLRYEEYALILFEILNNNN